MKKIILNLLLLTIVACTNTAFAAGSPSKTISADIGTKRIPQGSIIKLKLIDPISSTQMKLGDQFDLMTIEDVRVEKDVIIPCGSVVRGTIQSVTPSKRLSRGAVVYLNFDHIVSTTGKQVPLKVGMCYQSNMTLDGGLGSKTNYGTAIVKNAKNTAKIVRVSTTWGWETGDKVLSGYPKYALAPLCAIVSTPASGIYFIGDAFVDIFKKGDDVNVQQGTPINLMLLKPLDMPVY